jgi:hypothetical protein
VLPTMTTFIETYLYDADTRPPAPAEAVGEGALFAVAPGSVRSSERGFSTLLAVCERGVSAAVEFVLPERTSRSEFVPVQKRCNI